MCQSSQHWMDYSVQSPFHSSTFNSFFEGGFWLQTFWTQCKGICSLMTIASFIINIGSTCFLSIPSFGRYTSSQSTIYVSPNVSAIATWNWMWLGNYDTVFISSLYDLSLFVVASSPWHQYHIVSIAWQGEHAVSVIDPVLYSTVSVLKTSSIIHLNMVSLIIALDLWWIVRNCATDYNYKNWWLSMVISGHLCYCFIHLLHVGHWPAIHGMYSCIVKFSTGHSV